MTQDLAWGIVPEFIDKGVVTVEEVLELKEYLLDFLKNPKHELRHVLYALPKFIDKGVVTVEEVRKQNKYLMD